MYEISVASKYLTPRWRQLSVSIISLISIFVIALVVWLIVVFFSVTNGLEKSWIDKLIALTAPVRITPTEKYYLSYYYQADSISSASDYSLKTLGEKLASPISDPYNPKVDEELPPTWAKPDRNADGELKDPVKSAFTAIASIKDVPGLKAKDFEMTAATLRLRLLRNPSSHVASRSFPADQYNVATMSQASYLGSFDADNPNLSSTVLPLTSKDLTNTFRMIGVAADNIREDDAETIIKTPRDVLQSRLKSYFGSVQVSELSVPETGWNIPKALLPASAHFQALALSKNKKLLKVLIPRDARSLKEWTKRLESDGYIVEPVHLEIQDGQTLFHFAGEVPTPLPKGIPLAIPDQMDIQATLDPSSIVKANRPMDVAFNVDFTLQGVPLKGKTAIGSLLIEKADLLSPLDSETSIPLFGPCVQKIPKAYNNYRFLPIPLWEMESSCLALLKMRAS